MYILVNKCLMILGLFTDKTWLNSAIQVVRKSDPGCILYYQKVEVNTIDGTLINFWTMHPEKLIKISPENNNI